MKRIFNIIFIEAMKDIDSVDKRYLFICFYIKLPPGQHSWSLLLGLAHLGVAGPLLLLALVAAVVRAPARRAHEVSLLDTVRGVWFGECLNHPQCTHLAAPLARVLVRGRGGLTPPW